MKRILALFLVMGLFGCSNTEKETEDMVRNTLKDPDSAQFQNVNGRCGEVNAKNSYGGYTGFKDFYVANGVAVFRDSDDEVHSFEHGVIAFCQSKSNKSDNEKQKCANLADVSYISVKSKNNGANKGRLLLLVEREDNALEYKRMINDIYSKKTKIDPTKYALDKLYSCLEK